MARPVYFDSGSNGISFFAMSFGNSSYLNKDKKEIPTIE
jgi:hypothetical protein